MKVHLLLASAGVAAVLGFPVNGQDSQSTSFPPSATEIAPATVVDAQTFTNQAGVSNLFEIQSSELALTQASDEAVRAFAEQMIADHTKAGDDLRAAAAEQGSVAVPVALDQAHADKLAQLQAASGADFDALYIQQQTEAHIQAVALFSGYATAGEEGAVKTFAANTLPTLQAHYDHVLTLQR